MDCQTTTMDNVNRKDHVWRRVRDGWKCVLCGAVACATHPPEYPTPKDWMPDRYAKLTQTERDMCQAVYPAVF